MADVSGRSVGPADETDRTGLTPAEFAARFEGARQTLWYIAAAVLSDRTGADDVLQEAAVIALGKLSQFDAQTNFTAWMGRIVRFVALNHARRRIKSTAAVAVDPHALESVAVGREHSNSHLVLNGRGELMDGRENFDDHVLAALKTLDDTARACLLLRTLMDMPYRDISQALDIAEGTAMSHVHRARAALRERLKGRFSATSETAAEQGSHRRGQD
jgi:RNA polymerase sigma-70 factor (ECF subfamily)